MSERGVRPPRKRLTHRARDCQAAPPQPPESSTGGPEGDSRGTPCLPPPPRAPKRPEAGQGERRPRTPPAVSGETPSKRAVASGEGRHWAGTPRAPREPPAHSHSTQGRPIALRRRARAPRGPHSGGGTRTRAGAVRGTGQRRNGPP